MQSILGGFRSLVCPGIKDNQDITNCLTNINLSDTVVLVNVIIRAAFGLAGIIALIYLIYAGYLYMTSLGNPDSQAAAKGKLLNTTLGLIIIILAYLIVNFILLELTGKTIENPV